MRSVIVKTAVALLGLGFTLQGPGEPQQGTDLVARVADLEKRVTSLEKECETRADTPATPQQPQPSESLVPVSLSNKVFQDADPIDRGTYQDAVFWDARYDFSKLSKATRAIKGVLEFSDLFSEAKLCRVPREAGHLR